MSPFPPSAATDPNLPHGSLESNIVGVCSAMLALVTLVVGARFWIRFKLVKGQPGADDWCILVAWVLAAAFNIDNINQTKFGLGRHVYDLPPTTNFSGSLELWYFGEIMYYSCVAVTKIAILTLYLRLAVQRTFRRIICACILFVTLTAIAFVLASIFQCTPIRGAWDKTGTVPSHCINVNAMFYANAGLDIFQDALIYVLPMRMLYHIQVPRRQKVALMMVFAVGGFVVITGMVRLKFLKVAQNTPDPSYNNYGAGIWSSIECSIGVVCASLPTFKALVDRSFPSLIGHGHRGTSSTTNPADNANRTLRKSTYIRKDSESEVELEHGMGWKDLFADTSNRYSGGSSHNVSTAAAGSNSPPFELNSSEERLRAKETMANGAPAGGIWKSTSVVVSRCDR